MLDSCLPSQVEPRLTPNRIAPPALRLIPLHLDTSQTRWLLTLVAGLANNDPGRPRGVWQRVVLFIHHSPSPHSILVVQKKDHASCLLCPARVTDVLNRGNHPIGAPVLRHQNYWKPYLLR